MCPPLETSDLVPSQVNSLRARHIPGCMNMIADKINRHKSINPDRVAPFSAGVRSFVLKMGSPTSRFFCNPVQSQASQVCVTSYGYDSLGGRCLDSAFGES